MINTAWRGQAGLDVSTGDGNRNWTDIPERKVLLAGDVFVLIMFAYVGRASHGMGDFDLGVLTTAFPFLAGMSIRLCIVLMFSIFCHCPSMSWTKVVGAAEEAGGGGGEGGVPMMLYAIVTQAGSRSRVNIRSSANMHVFGVELLKFAHIRVFYGVFVDTGNGI